MKAAKLLLSAAASAVLSGSASAQLLGGLAGGGLPATAASPFGSSAPSSVLNGVVPPPGQGVGLGPGAQLPGSMNTIWSRLGISQEQREFCKRKMCRTPAGALMGRLMAPVSTLTGGVISPFCPLTPSVAELLDPGVVGAASKAKLDRAGAEERIKAVQYLGTLDCHYWPEAEEALIGALRGDRNECVRYEAAVALSKGCCCTCKVIVALSHVVSCSEADGFPYEKSARVRAVAANALDRCLQSSCCSACGDLPCLTDPAAGGTEQKKDGTKIEPGKDEKDKDGKDKSSKLGDPDFPKQYYAKVSRLPRPKIADFGHKAMEIGANIGYAVTDEVNARDYAAAGLASNRTQSSNAKPQTIMELLTWKDSTAAIGQPIVAPPPAAVSRPAAKAVATGSAMPPADLVSRPKQPAPVATAARPAPKDLPPIQVPTLPRSVGTEVAIPALQPAKPAAPPAPLPQPLIVPTITPAPVTPPAPKAKLTPVPPPSLPEMGLPMPMPAAVPPVKLPDVKPAEPTISRPPVEKLVPTLPPVETIAPGK